MPESDRRDFLKQTAALLAAGGVQPMNGNPMTERSRAEFTAYQARRRKELWSLLGDLPWSHKAGPAVVLGDGKARRVHAGAPGARPERR